ERKCDELLVFRRRLVECNHPDLVIELMDDRDLAGRRLENFERIGCRQVSQRPIRRAELARVIGDRAILEARHVLFIGFFALGRERQLAATDKLDLGVVSGGPIRPGQVRRLALPEGRPCQDRNRESGHQSSARTNAMAVIVHERPPRFTNCFLSTLRASDPLRLRAKMSDAAYRRAANRMSVSLSQSYHSASRRKAMLRSH